MRDFFMIYLIVGQLTLIFGLWVADWSEDKKRPAIALFVAMCLYFLLWPLLFIWRKT